MAAECEKELAAVGPDLSLLTNLGVARLELGEPDEAEEVLRAAARCPDAGARAFFNLGLVYSARGRKTAARGAYEHAVKLDPSHFESQVNLGNLLLSLQDFERALEVFRRASKVRPGDPSVTFMIAALVGGDIPRAPQQFVRRLFDQYAPTFEKSLQRNLGYRIPSALQEMFDRHRAEGSRCASLLDLGCGTGLVGSVFSDRCARLVGVDLAPKMIERAREKRCYDELHTTDMILFLEQTKLRFDLFIAADVFIYTGDLVPVFTGMRRCALVDALALFSVEHSEALEIRLMPTGHYAHSLEYVLRVGAETGWQPLEEQSIALRLDHGRPVAGRIVAMRFTGELRRSPKVQSDGAGTESASLPRIDRS